MPLESDATVIYGLEDYDGNFLPEYRNEDHSYNTWTNTGYPPGPICNPSRATIEAVLTMPKTTFLFWGKDNDGRLRFASSKKELDAILATANTEGSEATKEK